MIQMKTLLNVIDNSGAKLCECIQVYRKKTGSIGDLICVAIKDSKPSKTTKTQVKKGEVRKAVICRTRRSLKRLDGRYIKFDDNACVLVDDNFEPLGTRVMGVIGFEVKNKFPKVCSLAPRVV